MVDKLNKIRWGMAILFFILCIVWVVLDNVAFDEPEPISYEEKRILIDEYFDESINETVSVYRIIGYPDKVGISWNMTNRIPNSRFVCSFDFVNHTVVNNHNIYINYRSGDIRCVRENFSSGEKGR